MATVGSPGDVASLIEDEGKTVSKVMSKKTETETEETEPSFEDGWEEAESQATSTAAPSEDDQGEAAAEGQDAAPSDDHPNEETPSSETDDGSEQGAKKGDAAAARSDDDPSSKAEDASSEGETPAEGAGDEPQTVEERLDALQAQLAKNDQDQKAEIGRLRKQNKELFAKLAAKTEQGEAPDAVKQAKSKLREFDPDVAEAIETIEQHQQEQLNQKFQSGVEYVSQASEADQAQQLAVLDAELKDIPWQEYLARDEKTGQFSHAQFVEFLGSQPMNAVNEFISTEEAGPVAKMVRSFHASLGDDASIDPDTTGDGADGDQKATSQAKRRAAQKAATDGAAPSKGSGAKDADADDEDSFDAGWKAAAKTERRHAA